MQSTFNFPFTLSTNRLPSFSSLTFPSYSLHKSPTFPTLSSKSTTLTTTTLTKPSKITKLPSTPKPPSPKPPSLNVIYPPPSPPPYDPDFHQKALFLDSIGLDSLSLPPHHHHYLSTTSLSNLKSLFTYLLSFNFTPHDLRRIVGMCPQLLSLTDNDIVPVFTFLLREANLSGEPHLRQAISRRPRLLACSVDNQLRPTMYFLQSIGIHDVSRHTNLLSCSVEEKFMPKIHFFENVGFEFNDAVSMFRRFPPLFCYSVRENFEPKFNYFVIEMGRDLKELKEFPQYFSFSLEKRIKPRHQSCVEYGVCLSLPVMLKVKEGEFRERLDVCCNSSMPRSTSPLWCANGCDIDIDVYVDDVNTI